MPPPGQLRPSTRPQTQSQTRIMSLYKIGTRVKKKFNDNQWYEGKITGYDSKEGFYKVLYNNGDSEEYTHTEIRTMVRGTTKTRSKVTLPEPRAHNIYIPTPKKKHKLQSNIKQNTPPYKPTVPSVYTHGYQRAAKALMIEHMAMVGGSIWDEELQKFAAYKDLSKYPNPAI